MANAFWPVAIAWHVVVLVAVCSLAVGWRPRRRVAMQFLALPLFSGAALARLGDNPFNALILTAVGVMAIIASRSVDAISCVRRGDAWMTTTGASAVVYACIYPHFVESDSVLFRTVAAPVGVIPCPTLALVLGFGLLAGNFESRAWSRTIGVAGILYGSFGLLRLRVYLDVGLVLVAVAALVFDRAAPRRPATATAADDLRKD